MPGTMPGCTMPSSCSAGPAGPPHAVCHSQGPPSYGSDPCLRELGLQPADDSEQSFQAQFQLQRETQQRVQRQLQQQLQHKLQEQQQQQQHHQHQQHQLHQQQQQQHQQQCQKQKPKQKSQQQQQQLQQRDALGAGYGFAEAPPAWMQMQQRHWPESQKQHQTHQQQQQLPLRSHRRMPLDGLGLVLPMAVAPGTWAPEGLLPDTWEPTFGAKHQFHMEACTMGELSSDQRSFTKRLFDGRLSVITEGFVNYQGRLEYLVQFTGGELSSADGVGFILSPKLPCPKNIQKITSIFANRTGRICVRANSEVVRSDVSIRPLEIGDLVSVVVDLDQSLAQFTIWPAEGETPSTALFDFGTALERLRMRIPNVPKCRCGYFACVIKNAGVTVKLGS